MPIKFATRAREDYLYWQETDRTVLRRINALIKDIERQPFFGYWEARATQAPINLKTAVSRSRLPFLQVFSAARPLPDFV